MWFDLAALLVFFSAWIVRSLSFRCNERVPLQNPLLSFASFFAQKAKAFRASPACLSTRDATDMTAECAFVKQSCFLKTEILERLVFGEVCRRHAR
eukprot:m.434949 g.434949  ORF g.434949 m.434949 type:complete len:96 (+) comp56760_c0_seq26:1495-1782(+)